MIQRRYLVFQQKKGDFDRYKDDIELLKEQLTVNNPDYHKLKNVIAAYEHKLNKRKRNLRFQGKSQSEIVRLTTKESETIRKMKVALRYKQPKICFYFEKDDCLCVPRHFTNEFEGIDKRIEGVEIGITGQIQLKDHQNQPVAEIASNKADILVSDTGSGKTIMLIESVVRMKRPTCVVVNKEALLNQWYERFKQFADVKVGLHYSKVKYCGEPVCITTVQTLLRMDYMENREFYDRFGIAIFDEVHRYGGFEFRKVIDNFPAKRRIGCTATVDRNDHFNIFKWSVGQRIYKVGKTDVLVPDILFHSLPFHFWESHYQKYLEEVVNSVERNKYIIQVLKGFLKSNRRVFVLTHRVEHAYKLYEVLTTEKEFESTSVVFVGETQKNVTIDDSIQCVFATYQLMGEGMDFPAFDTEILTTPFSDQISSKQVPGRLARVYVGKKEPLVLDLVDQDNRAQNFYHKRKGFYKKNGYKITDNVKFTDVGVKNGELV